MKLSHKSRLWAAAALSVLTLTASPALATAMQGPDGSSGSSSDNASSHLSTHKVQVETTSSSSDDNQSSTEANDTSGDGSTGNGNDSLRDRAEQLLAQQRQKGIQHSTAVRQKVCEQRQKAIDGRMGTLGTKAQKFLDAYNTIFTKVQAYQTKHQLDVSNYDTLVADATAKQAAATTAVSTLSGLAGTKIDCTSTDPASTLATVKTAATDARTSLQAYRQSLKALIEALITASTAANTSTNSSTSTGGNQ